MDASIHHQKLSAKSGHVALPWLQQFELITRQFPNHQAILNPSGDSFSYQELDSKANQLANYLRDALGRLPAGHTGQIVAVCFSRVNVEVATAFLAVLKLGAAIHFVEPKLGIEVNNKRLKKISPDLVLLDEDNAHLSHDIEEFETLVLSEHQHQIDQSAETIIVTVGSRNSACVFCSSGTTGEPKVITMPMLPLSNLTRSASEELHLCPESRLIQLARRNFDAVVHELAISLGNGACLVLVDEQTMFCHQGFVEFIEEQQVSHMTITPSHISHLLKTHEGNPSRIFEPLNTVMLVGEAFSDDLPPRLAKAGVSRVVNGYGPSEAGIWVMSSVLFDSGVSTEIMPTTLGKPVRGVDVRVMRQCDLTHTWQLCEAGEKGELLVSNRLQNVYKDQKNNQSRYLYIPDPITDNIECFYRTGDIVEISDQNELIFVGRQDNQIKLAGQLVVTDEVANQLKEACVTLFKARNIDIYIDVERNSHGTPVSLTAYHTAETPQDADNIACEISRYLTNQLPSYMLPKRYAWLERFPIKVGGKLDTVSIQSNAQDSKRIQAPQTLPQTVTQLGIASIWQHILSMNDSIYLEHSFTDLGGTSLQLLSMLSEVNREFGIHIKSDSLMHNDTLLNLSVAVESAISCPQSETLLSPSEINSLIEMKSSEHNKYLFLVHPGDGHVQVYQKMMPLLPDTLNVYGLRAPGAEAGEEIVPFSVLEYAQRYANLIMKQQPHGDVFIMGYCAGAPISIEIARLLEQSNRKVAMLALVDLPNGYHLRENTDIAQGLATFFEQMYGVDVSAKQLREHVDSETQFEHLFELALQQGKVAHNKKDQLRNALNGVMYEPEQEDSVETLHLFFKYAFKLDIPAQKLRNLSNEMDRLNYIVNKGRAKGVFPAALTSDYFSRLLAMENTTKEAVHGYVPAPLSIQGKILYLHAQPSIENPMAWYPNPQTWVPYLNKMEVQQLKGDHYSIVREDQDMKDLIRCLAPHITVS